MRNYINYIKENKEQENFIEYCLSKDKPSKIFLAFNDVDKIMKIIYHNLKKTVKLKYLENIPNFFKYMLENDISFNVDIAYDDGVTLLMLSALRGYTDLAKVLIEAGADINIQNKYGVTALLLATAKDEYDIMELLLKAGADINIQNIYGKDALFFASIKAKEIFKKYSKE